MNKTIISLGGSIVCPKKLDTQFLADFRDCLVKWLSLDSQRQIYLVVGGGFLAREYQQACKHSNSLSLSHDLDILGISATHLNAQLIHSVCKGHISCQYWEDYTKLPQQFTQLVVMAGWKPGFSTDFCAVSLAEKLSVTKLINLSNIVKVYDCDPNLNSKALAIDKMSWDEFQSLVGQDWQPGGNYPFDPIASLKSKELSLSVTIADGRNIANLLKILNEEDFCGTIIQA